MRTGSRLLASLALALATLDARADSARPPVDRSAPDLVAQARTALGEGRLDEAERLARAALARDPGAVAAWRVAGLAAFRAGRWEPARAAFLEEISRAASSIARFNLAAAEFKLERWEQSERDYLAAAEDPELAPLATLDAGLAADGAGHRADALGHYRAAVAIAEARGAPPVADKARQLIAETEQAQRDEHRDEAWKHARAGGAAFKQGRLEQAIASLERALAEARAGGMPEADRAEIDYALGHALLDEDKPAEAIGAFRRAIAAAPKDPEFHFMLALALERAGDRKGAAGELRLALDRGLTGRDAERARERLAAIADETRRLTVETQVAAGYDTNYAGGREVPQGSATQSGKSIGAAEVVADVEPRVRLFGSPTNGMYLGDRFDALIYLSRDADPFTILEDDLYLEGNWSPRAWLRLSATAEGWFETAGLLDFGPYQVGGQGVLKALFLEGRWAATRLRYAHAFVRSLQQDYDYMTGDRDELSASQLFFVRTWRFGLRYAYSDDLVGAQEISSTQLFDPLKEEQASQRCAPFLPAPCPTLSYHIPYSYVGNALGVDANGELGGGVHAGIGFRWEHRNYLDAVQVTRLDTQAAVSPAQARFHPYRVDDRFAIDAYVRREVAWGIAARLSFYLLLSRSNIDNGERVPGAPAMLAFPFDYDDKNFYRIVATVDVMRSF